MQSYEKIEQFRSMVCIHIANHTNISILDGIDYATNFRKRDGYLYEICDPGEELGKNIRRDAQTIYNNKKYGGRHEFAYQKEIAFKGGIPAKYIIQSTYYSQNQKSGSVFFNPIYNP